MRKHIALIASLLVTTACASDYTGDPQMNPGFWQQPYPVGAQVTTDYHVVNFTPGANALDGEQRGMLAQLIAGPGAEAVHRVSITTSPQFSPASRKLLTRELRALGLESGKIQFVSADPTISLWEARLETVYSVAVLPAHCPNWSTPADKNFTNELPSNFGCSQATNMGMMVANPQDINGNSVRVQPSAGRNALVVGHYHAGYDWSSVNRSYEGSSAGNSAGASAASSAVTASSLAPSQNTGQ